MRAPTSIARQIFYAVAMPTGIALVGMLLGCAHHEGGRSAQVVPADEGTAGSRDQAQRPMTLARLTLFGGPM